jgi:hypothetical protein
MATEANGYLNRRATENSDWTAGFVGAHYGWRRRFFFEDVARIHQARQDRGQGTPRPMSILNNLSSS